MFVDIKGKNLNQSWAYLLSLAPDNRKWVAVHTKAKLIQVSCGGLRESGGTPAFSIVTLKFTCAVASILWIS